MALTGTFTTNPTFGNVTATGTVDLGNTGSEMKVFRRFYGDTFVNDLDPPIDSPVYQMNFGTDDYIAFYKFTYGVSMLFRNPQKELEIHGWNPQGNGGLGGRSPFLTFLVGDGINTLQFRNPYDTNSLIFKSTTNSNNFTILTESANGGNGNIIFSPHGTGQVSFTKPINFTAQTAEPADPVNNSAVMWMTDGTGAGDAGDVMVKVTSGSVTKTITLVDYSAAA